MTLDDQRVQELSVQVGFDQLRKILDGLAPSTPPLKSNKDKDWILGPTTIKHEDIRQEIQEKMINGNVFSKQYIISHIIVFFL